MKGSQYIVRCDKQSSEAATFDEALRLAMRLREWWGLPTSVYDPTGRKVAVTTACFDGAPAEDSVGCGSC